MKIVSIVGARPQFVKAAAVSRKLRQSHEEFLLHTGQHYDYLMSGVFFDGLELPKPQLNLGIGSGSHGAQTGAMLKAIEDVLLSERPDSVLIYGDTNSTLAGALAASKMEIPVVHVEAGLRSFNRAMPEEINRVIADHLSSLLLCPSDTAIHNLSSEGISLNVHLVGDVMLDVLRWAEQQCRRNPSRVVKALDLGNNSYLVATLHRSENTDVKNRLRGILDAFNLLDECVVFPVHPRTRKAVAEIGFRPKANVRLIDPLGYLEMIELVSSARMVLTDSGGLQKEAYWLGVPCLTMRNETEWIETVNEGWNTLVGADKEKIIEAVNSFSPPDLRRPLYGLGAAAEKCVELIGSQSVAFTPTVGPSNAR